MRYYALIALLGSSQAVRMNSDNQLGAPAWDCVNSPTPNNKSTCWGDEAYQRCHGGQWAYDAVMKAGGSTKEAYELLEALKLADCPSIQKKSDCKNSPTPDNKNTCWADDAYQKCGNNRQGAYDAVMKKGGSTPLAYMTYEALLKDNCGKAPPAAEEAKGMPAVGIEAPKLGAEGIKNSSVPAKPANPMGGGIKAPPMDATKIKKSMAPMDLKDHVPAKPEVKAVPSKVDVQNFEPLNPDGGIDMDPAHDAAYWPLNVNTGNYTYSVKPNEYTSWNTDSVYTHNYQTTGDFSGANRVPEHTVPAFDLGIDEPS